MERGEGALASGSDGTHHAQAFENQFYLNMTSNTLQQNIRNETKAVLLHRVGGSSATDTRLCSSSYRDAPYVSPASSPCHKFNPWHSSFMCLVPQGSQAPAPELLPSASRSLFCHSFQARLPQIPLPLGASTAPRDGTVSLCHGTGPRTRQDTIPLRQDGSAAGPRSHQDRPSPWA